MAWRRKGSWDGRKEMSCKECLQAFRGPWCTRKYIHDMLLQKVILEQMTKCHGKIFWLCLRKRILLKINTKREKAVLRAFCPETIKGKTNWLLGSEVIEVSTFQRPGEPVTILTHRYKGKWLNSDIPDFCCRGCGCVWWCCTEDSFYMMKGTHFHLLFQVRCDRLKPKKPEAYSLLTQQTRECWG